MANGNAIKYPRTKHVDSSRMQLVSSTEEVMSKAHARSFLIGWFRHVLLNFIRKNLYHHLCIVVSEKRMEQQGTIFESLKALIPKSL